MKLLGVICSLFLGASAYATPEIAVSSFPRTALTVIYNGQKVRATMVASQITVYVGSPEEPMIERPLVVLPDGKKAFVSQGKTEFCKAAGAVDVSNPTGIMRSSTGGFAGAFFGALIVNKNARGELVIKQLEAGNNTPSYERIDCYNY
jgi:hypothetical protein